MFAAPQQDPFATGQARKIEVKPQKRQLFGSVKGPAAAPSVGKRTIGAPILQDNDGLNPLNKIATMDLKEAARREQERRANLQRGGRSPG